jgi:tripeptide aminopeptidase
MATKAKRRVSKQRPTKKRTAPLSGRKSSKRTCDPFELVMQLMAIRGKSGEEVAVAEFVKRQLVQAGAKQSDIKFDTAHKKTPIEGEIGNMVFKLPGTMRGPRRLLMAHLDTVPTCQGSQPVKKGNFVRSADPRTALGADDRAGVAVVLHAALRMLYEQPRHPPLTFLWTVQEEIGLFGARYVRKSLLGKPQLAFNWDGGSAEKLTIGATGGYKTEIIVHGIASHAGSRPEGGVSAIAIASQAIADLQANGWHGLIEKNGKQGTSNVGMFHGGEATNVVSDLVHVRAEARSHDAKFRKRILTEIEKAFTKATKQVKNTAGQTGTVEINSRLDYESFRLKQSEPSVKAAEAAVRRVGGEPLLYVVNGGLDANWMSVHDIPTVTLGCGQTNPHMVTEALDLRDFNMACEIGYCLATGSELATATNARSYRESL